MKSIAEIFRSYGVLDADGRHINGTDKETNHHYGDTYERIIGDNWLTQTFNPGRMSVRLMMEIGVADGSSLLAWRDIFPNALCVGLDIHEASKLEGQERIEFHLGDQRMRACCERAINGRMFDFIVEDATHRLEDSLVTLFFLWPSVKPGGMYVIEEFDGVHSLRNNIQAMWPYAKIIGTCGPEMKDEPLVVLRKPL